MLILLSYVTDTGMTSLSLDAYWNKLKVMFEDVGPSIGSALFCPPFSCRLEALWGSNKSAAL
jgi:hypothetical protein